MHTEGKLKFSVDAALLRELGERLVGQAHVALGELIKNSYDADARHCEIEFGDDEIILTDDGHGMSKPEFEAFWMRVGTTHKAKQAFSPQHRRPLTGSKGVGRLAVQFLARNLRIETRAKKSEELLTVTVDWPSAVAADELVEAVVEYEVDSPTTVQFAADAPHGMRIVLTGLNHVWDSPALKSVAREVWELVPPFDDEQSTDPRSFSVSVRASEGPELASGFSRQLKAALDQWIATIEGEVVGGRNDAVERVTVTFADGTVFSENFAIDDCLLHRATWRIAVYNLRGRLAHDVPVQEAREYLERYGGVHVYDGDFRLPYYGVAQDWLSLEFDHSHRRVKSKLLPDALHVQRALNDLPTQGRLFGTVRVNTGIEQRRAPAVADGFASEHLQIQVTRDRLVSNRAYEQLRDAVRRSIDYYATRSMLRRIQRAHEDRPTELPSERISRMSTVLETFEGEISQNTYAALQKEISEFVESTRREQAYIESIQQLLGPLASAGMAAIALEHETSRELLVLDDLADRLDTTKSRKFDPAQISLELKNWIRRVRETREVFAPLLAEEDRSAGHRLLVLKVVERSLASTRAFTEGAEIEIIIPRDLRFPEGSIAEWSAILQNVLINAVNAVDERTGKLIIWITAGGSGRQGWLRISDTGKGIDLSSAERLFDPFRRQSEVSKRLGLGGLGLGLTIVRMIAESRNCTASFVPPDEGFKTTFELRWS